MSFNIRYAAAKDGSNCWELRRGAVAEILQQFGGDFVGLQEAMDEQVAFLSNALPQYGCISRSREADAGKGEAGPIFYRHERWQPDGDQQGTFWLSPTPTVPGSIGWGARLPRIVTWARFIDKDCGCAVYVYNTHFSHISLWARFRGSMLLSKHIATRAHPDPVIVTGDFNSIESSMAVRYLQGRIPGSPVRLVDTFRTRHPLQWIAGTYHGFFGIPIGPRIDYVLTLPSAQVLRADILRDTCDPTSRRYPSDHYPVTAELFFSQSPQLLHRAEHSACSPRVERKRMMQTPGQG